MAVSPEREAVRSALLTLIDALSFASIVIVTPSGQSQTFQMPPVHNSGEPLSAPANGLPVPRPEIVGDVADAIRDVLHRADRPIKCNTIASRARREPHSHFRAVLRRMVQAGEVLHLPGNRYELAEADRPAERG